MSLSKSKLDLLVRVRYNNNLPPPPCPPKLLTIETTPKRYARPDFIDAVVADTPIPMVVDAELGMPLDLSLWDCLWDEAAAEDDLNPSSNLPELDPADEFLAADWIAPTSQASGAGILSSAASGSGTGTSTPTTQSVSWLRRTEYITGTASTPKAAIAEQQRSQLPAVDISHAAQIAAIEASFASCNENFQLESLSHPTKKGLKAVDSYEILPDADIWENAYDLFRFAERPGERPHDADDPRLDCAILRPMEYDGDHFLAYYLTETDEAALEFKERRAATSPYQVQEEDWETVFQFVRDYETVMIEKEVPNEFLLVLEEGTDPDQRARGAYYKNIERKMILKKRRANREEYDQDQKWELIRLTHATIGMDEEEERDDARAEVLDPTYTVRLMSGRADADADAEGEIDQDAVALDV